MLGRIIEFFVVFCYLFCFSLRGGHGVDSSMVVAAYLIIYGVFNPGYSARVLKFIFSTYSRRIYALYVVINIWIIFIISATNSFDFSYMLTFLHMLFLIIVGMLVFLYFSYRGTANRIVWLMVAAFALQSVIEWCAFLIPSFKEIINFTKSEETIAKGQSYAGVRANCLAGSDFFGLSAAFSVMYIIFLSHKNTWFATNRALKFLLFVFLLSGTFFAGRTGYVGLIVVFLFAMFNKREVFSKRKTSNKERLLWAIIIGSFFTIISTIIFLYNTNEDIHNLLNFTFQNIFTLLEEGSMKTSSMESLDNMYFTIEPLTFLFGAGQYVTKDGGYYMSTDVGYMRVILYMGVIGLMMLLSMQCIIMQLRNGTEIKLKKYLFLLLLILHAKGEVIVWNQIVLDTVVLFCLQDTFNNKFCINKKVVRS